MALAIEYHDRRVKGAQ